MNKEFNVELQERIYTPSQLIFMFDKMVFTLIDLVFENCAITSYFAYSRCLRALDFLFANDLMTSPEYEIRKELFFEIFGKEENTGNVGEKNNEF